MDFLGRIILSGLVGGVYGFFPGLWKVSFLLVFPIMKNQSNRRISVYSLAFYSVSMIPVFLVSFGYSGEMLLSFLIFVFVVGLSSFLMTLCFTGGDNNLLALLKIALFFLIFLFPPFSSLPFSSPVWLSGAMFPGFGMLGIMVFMFLVFSLRYKPVVGVAIMAGMLVFAPSFAKSPNDAVAISTSKNQQKENSPASIFYSRINDLGISKNQNASVVYFPESYFGNWHKEGGVGDIFKNTGVKIIGGAKYYVRGEDIKGVRKYRYVIADLTNNKILYSQRSMAPQVFNPFVTRSLGDNTTTNGIVNVSGSSVGFLICWESLSIPTLVSSLMSKPEYVVLFANTYWSKYYNAGDVLSYHFKTWADLFGVPSLVSINEAPNV